MKSLYSAYWSFTMDWENRVRGLGLNYGNPKIIIYVLANEGCKQVDIARNCYVESATVSAVLSKMEENGLIRRERLENNRRSYAIKLTSKGRETFTEVKRRFDETFAIAFSGFSENELEELQSYLDRITDNLEGSGS